MVELFDTWAHTLGVLGYPILGLAALIEYLAPPFPGDTLTLLGGAYVARGERSWVLVLLALTVGSMVGIAATWGVGGAIGGRVDRMPEGRLLPGVTHAQLRRAQALMRERGDLLLVLNRFIPTFRSVLFLAAGAAHMPLRRVMFLGTLSALLWNGLLLAVGIEIGGNVARIEHFLSTYQMGAFVVGGVVVALLVAFFWRRRRGVPG